MSVTSGFYNSLNHDRVYSAFEMGSIFDGIIEDGVYASIGEKFIVTASSGMEVLVGSGRAWINHSWLFNDTKDPITIPQAEAVAKRIDAVVIEINRNESVRTGRIFVKTGSPASNPNPPTMTKNSDITQFPIAYILVKPGVSRINQEDITNMVGTSECPFVTGPLHVAHTDELVRQWEAEFEIMFAQLQARVDQIVQGKIPDGAVSSTLRVRLTKGSWISNSNGVEKEFYVPGLMVSDNPIVDIDFESISGGGEAIQSVMDSWSVYRIKPVREGYIKVYATSEPDVEIPIKMLCVRK